MIISSDLEKKIKSLSSLPSPPVVALRLIELAKDPNLEIRTLCAVIALDPALSGKVLRVANSALYGQYRRSETLRQALMVLGLNPALTLCLSFSLLKSVQGTAGDGPAMAALWRRSALAGIAARSLGEVLRQPVEELFLAALLQDIGLLALSRINPELYTDRTQAAPLHDALIKAERSQFGADHAEVGAWMLKTWNMPERTLDAVSRSHANFDTTNLSEFDAIVALSGPIADFFMHAQSAPAYEKVSHLAGTLLELNGEQLQLVFDQMGLVLPDAEALFDMVLVESPAQILGNARDLLLQRQLAGAA